MAEIINRVANSKLEVFNLEDHYVSGQRTSIDITQWLYEGLVLREKEFRSHLKNHNWEQYTNHFVAIHCSADAIVPDWAYMLITLNLEPFAKHIIIGDLNMLETSLYQNTLDKLNFSEFKNKPVIIKGCSKKPVPLNAYTLAATKLKPFAKSIMFGEACSAVPLYKAPKK